MQTTLPIVTLKQNQRVILCSTPETEQQQRTNSVQVLIKLPVDIDYRMRVQNEELDIVSMFSILLDGIDVHIDRRTDVQTYQAAAGLAKLNLENWQRAIAWCMQLYLKRPLNLEPFPSKEYQAMRLFGDYVYAKFEFIASVFQAFESVDSSAPLLKHGFAETFLWAIVEDINRDNQCTAPTETEMVKTAQEDIRALKQRQTIYTDLFPTNSLLFSTAFTVMQTEAKDSNPVKRQRSLVRKAYTKMVRTLEKWNTCWRNDPDRYGFCCACVKDGQVFMPQKRTKGKPATRKLTDIPKHKQFS